MQICRICMNTDRKMYVFNTNRVHLYEQLTGTTFVFQDLLPKYVCWECEHYMSKYVAFKSKAMRSLCILTEILRKEGLVSQTNCSQYKLQSSLASGDVFIDVSIDQEKTISLLEPSPEVKIENEYIENNVNIFIDIKDGVTQDPIDDNHQCSDDIFITDTLIPSPSIIDIENKDSAKEDKRSPEKHSYVKSKRKKKICRTSNDGEKRSPIKKENRKNNVENNNKNTNSKKMERILCAKGNSVATAKTKKHKSIFDVMDKNIINVTELTLDEQIAEVQSRKESVNYISSPFRCDKCFRGFTDNDVFNRHLVRHADSAGAHECPLCKTRHNNIYRLTVHMKTHMYKFSCQQCRFCTRTLEIAKRHAIGHKGKRHPCPHCEETYTHRNSLLSHIRIKHPSDDVVCQHCGLAFVNDKGLGMHLNKLHRLEDKVVPEDGPHCARCDVRFSSQEALEKHIQVSGKHTDERKGPAMRNTLETNKMNEQAKKVFSQPYPDGPRRCKQCDEKLPNPGEYYRHIRIKHINKKREVICEVCGRLFKNTILLRHHMYLHSDTKEFKCERCGKQFQLRSQMMSHRKYHCGTRRDYPCRVCGKSFASQSNRYRHEVVHSGCTYKCELCDKVFKCPWNKNTHITYVHKRKPWPIRKRGPRKRPEGQTEATLQDPPSDADSQEEWKSP